ncbi:MAG: glycoside hydrolase family 15 protein [Betaproteobacteria bacterium]|nr:MAG: glycoside hydrolase family 15 protein [Betaproteobacteria bacterium]
MPSRIEDYALLGNTRTAALVGRDGSIDWMCVPRFDSPACFAALIGDPKHGRWLLAPRGPVRRTQRHYRDRTLVLETEFMTSHGAVRIVDCMSLWQERTDLIRVVEGLRGNVPMRMELIIRCDYGRVVPWVRRVDGALLATAGPDSLELRSEVEVHGEDFTTVSDFKVGRGERVRFVLTYFPSHHPRPVPIDPDAAIGVTERSWRAWCGRSAYDGRWGDAVIRSLITLKALTYAPTGGIVAAPTTSLPEEIGGVRNWDYRYCWPRDATFVLYALLVTGYRDEARAWRQWLLRAAAGRPEDMQSIYGIAGERQLTELELPWLPGYEGSAPVRVGNAAAAQKQLDVYGEVIDTLQLARVAGLDPDADAWNFERALLGYLGSHWREPDNGIWEVRGEPRHFTHSKVMAWVAIDRAIKAAEEFSLRAPLARWRALRARIHADVCHKAYNAAGKSFVQYYGSDEVDASLLLMPLVGFLPSTDVRIKNTLAAIERELVVDGLVARYRTRASVDGLPPGEGVFLPSSFWLADALSLAGRQAEAVALFSRLLALRNDVGLIAEEYDPVRRRQLGNFPQALTHVAIINTARNLSRAGGPCEHRSRGMRDALPGVAEMHVRRGRPARKKK